MNALRVGLKLHGYCDGYFGRNSYSDKRVEAFGADWIVAREENGLPVFANVEPTRIDESVARWAKGASERHR